TSFMLMMTVTLLLSMAAAAQAGTGGGGGNGGGGVPSASPGSAPSDQTSGSTPAGGNVGQDQTSSQSSTDKTASSGKTIKGCIVQQGGNYMLQEKGGKMANISSTQDLSAHVGHSVKLHGDWSNSSASTSGVSGSTTASSGA